MTAAGPPATGVARTPVAAVVATAIGVAYYVWSEVGLRR